MGYYEIIVENHLDKKRARFFEGMSLENLPDSRTLLYGNLKDQSELFSILNKIRDMNLTLVSVKKDDMKMEVELW
jgi:hypothetical protein